MPTELENALRKVGVRVKQHADPAKKPYEFVRDVHRQWKVDGGKAAGKPRHSDRYLEDQLKAQGVRIRSLTPKLVGKTNINLEDGVALIRFFLSHWPEPGAKEGEIDYKLLLSDAEIGAIAEFIEDQLAQHVHKRPAPPMSPSTDVPGDTLPGEPVAELILRHFEECDALITVAPEEPLVAAAPKTEIIGFRELIDNLRTIEARDHRKRVLIWVLDLGGVELNDYATRKKYLGVQRLFTRFKALDHFKDNRSEERLEWLKSRGVIVLLDAFGDWGGHIQLPKRPGFTAHHATITNINPDWAASANFRALYGSEMGRIYQRIYNVFFNASCEWPTEPDIDGDLRYFGYATFESSKDGPVARGLELPPLSLSYATALRTVCAAATHTLKLKIPPSRELEVNGEDAAKRLNYLGFRVLRIDEFVAMY